MRTLNSVFVKQPLSLVCDMARLTIQSLMIFFFQDREGINKNIMHSRCKFQWSMLQVHTLFSCENDPIMTHVMIHISVLITLLRTLCHS